MELDVRVVALPFRVTNENVDEVTDALGITAAANRYYDQVYAQATEDLDAANKTRFDQWWNSGIRDSGERHKDWYKKTYEDYRPAHNALFWAIGRGCG